MADEPAAAKPKSWLKTILGALAGLFSGALLMYLTPLIDRVIKPAKPVANFGHQADGLSVTFHNRSSGANTGWWDFGDGSPLEPIAPNQDIVTHTYPRTGEYSVKLMLRNLFNEEHERSVVVRVEPPRNDPPAISAFEVIPVSPGSYAPATFRIISKVQNAQLFVWDYGDDRPLEIRTDKESGHERMVTFDKPGGYVVKLAAVNGTQAAVKSDIVQVNVPPAGAVTAVLSVTDQATRVETIDVPYTFSEAFPPTGRDTTVRIDRQVPAKPDCEITDVRVVASGGGPRLGGKAELTLDAAALGLRGVRNLKLQLASDRRSLRLTGELVKDSGLMKKGVPPPALALPVVMVQQKRVPASRAAIPMTATLAAPGSVLLSMPPLPADWVEPQRQARVELREGDRVVWQESKMPRSAVVTVQNRRWIASATPVGNQVRVDLVELPAGAIPSTN